MPRFWIKPSMYGQNISISAVTGRAGALFENSSPSHGIYEVSDSVAPLLEESFASIFERKPTFQEALLDMQPYAYLPMDEARGSIWDKIQRVEFARTGTGVTYRSASLLPNGEGYSIVNSGGSSNYWTAPSNSLYQLHAGVTKSWTVLMWFRNDETSTAATYMASMRPASLNGLNDVVNGDGGWRALKVNAVSHAFRRGAINNAEPEAQWVAPSDNGVSHLAVATVQYVAGLGYVMTGYTDGAQVAQSTHPLPSAPSSLPLRIAGASWSTSATWKGALQHFTMWDRALSAAEVATLWRAAH